MILASAYANSLVFDYVTTVIPWFLMLLVYAIALSSSTKLRWILYGIGAGISVLFTFPLSVFLYVSPSLFHFITHLPDGRIEGGTSRVAWVFIGILFQGLAIAGILIVPLFLVKKGGQKEEH